MTREQIVKQILEYSDLEEQEITDEVIAAYTKEFDIAVENEKRAIRNAAQRAYYRRRRDRERAAF